LCSFLFSRPNKSETLTLASGVADELSRQTQIKEDVEIAIGWRSELDGGKPCPHRILAGGWRLEERKFEIETRQTKIVS
jgi:hypothetical protein